MDDISRLRDLINQPRRQHHLAQNKTLWNQLCSSLDVIDDTDQALTAHVDIPAQSKSASALVILYGVLQLLYVQQDAVMNLGTALGIPVSLKDYPRLQVVRDIRNDSIGHPTRRNHKKEPQPSSHFVYDVQLRPLRFKMISESDRTQFKEISVDQLIVDQRMYVSAMLGKLVTSLEEDDKTHRAKFKGKPLAAVFSDQMGYYFEKVFNGLFEGGDRVWASTNLKMVADAISQFRVEIIARAGSLHAYAGIADSLRRMEYAMSKVEGFLIGTQVVDRDAAYIFADFVREGVNHLRLFAQDIDLSYGCGEGEKGDIQN